jgi:hypothetical protein
MKSRYKKIYGLLFLLVLLNSFGCRKFVTVDTPDTLVSTESAYKSDQTATSVVTGIYAQLNSNYLSNTNIGATSIQSDLAADNLMLFDVNTRPDLGIYYQNALDPTYSGGINTYWKTIYQMLYTINGAIEALTNNKDLTPAVSKRLLGEVYFMRAFSYFYLVNIYGDVPLILTTTYTTNKRVARSNTSDVYNQINEDLSNAEGLLDNTYVSADALTSTNQRLRPNLATVNALQARTLLYEKNYTGAETAASKVIAQSGQYSLVDLDATFLGTSKETIWAMQSVNLGFNTVEAYFFTILPDIGFDFDRPSYISKSLFDSFEPGDDRKNKWVGVYNDGLKDYPCPAKYKISYEDASSNVTEYTVVFRLAEQYLIRAEARNEQGNMGGAADDLNALRDRARTTDPTIPNSLPAIARTLGQEQMRAVILHERRVELFTEWGHRWFDLKRSGTMDAVMTEAEKVKGGTWASYKSLDPIPSSEILLNSLLTQNPGYIK